MQFYATIKSVFWWFLVFNLRFAGFDTIPPDLTSQPLNYTLINELTFKGYDGLFGEFSIREYDFIEPVTLTALRLTYNGTENPIREIQLIGHGMHQIED